MSSESDRAGSTIVLLGLVGAMGLVASVAGVAVVGGSAATEGGTTGWGSVVVVLVGLASGLLLLAATIAWAVELGVRASGVLDRLPTGTRRAPAAPTVRGRHDPARLEPLDPVD